MARVREVAGGFAEQAMNLGEKVTDQLGDIVRRVT